MPNRAVIGYRPLGIPYGADSFTLAAPVMETRTGAKTSTKPRWKNEDLTDTSGYEPLDRSVMVVPEGALFVIVGWQFAELMSRYAISLEHDRTVTDRPNRMLLTLGSTEQLSEYAERIASSTRGALSAAWKANEYKNAHRLIDAFCEAQRVVASLSANDREFELGILYTVLGQYALYEDDAVRFTLAAKMAVADKAFRSQKAFRRGVLERTRLDESV